jgi:cyclic pyranopterin phosphate synthase
MSINSNMVAMRDSNLDHVMPMRAFYLGQGCALRFIELMRMGHQAQHAEAFRCQFVGQREPLERIEDASCIPPAAPAPVSPKLGSSLGVHRAFGIIADESASFCWSCSRLRLCSTG